MFPKILIPVDGTPTSEHAARYGVALAARLASTVVFTHVLEGTRSPLGGDRQEATERARTLSASLLAQWQREAQELGATVHSSERGDVAEAICDAALEEGCALIAMGTHGRTGLPRALLGSVAERVSRLAAVSVLLLRSSSGVPELPERILVATDGSPHAVEAVRQADGLALALGAELLVLHVAFDVSYAMGGLRPVEPISGLRERTARLEEARARLREHGAALLDAAVAGCRAPTSSLLLESVSALTSDVIRRVAEERRMDLIVVGSHGQTGLRSFLLGSVASEVIHLSPGPVLLSRGEAQGAAPGDAAAG